MKKQLDKIEKELEQERAARNEDTQYHRSSLNVKIMGIPYQKGEEIKADANNKASVSVIETKTKTKINK